MSLNDKMTGLADTVRGVSGVSGKLSIDDMKTQVSQLGSFRDFGQMPNGTDADDCLKTGVYRIDSKDAYKNVPTSFGVLTVMAPQSGTAYVLQQAVSAIDVGVLYQRVKNGGFGWSDWVRLGGIINPVLSVFKRVVAPLIGGVAYVA